MMDKQLVTNIFNRVKHSKKPSLPIPDSVWTDPLMFIAFGFGSGAIPFAPGTFGTLLAIPFYLLLQPLSLTYYLIFVLLFFIASVYLCSYASRKTATDDHPGMCIDEFVGFFITMINAPHGWQWVLFGFVLFRLFDILKPYPINIIDEKIHGGFGMVLDDAVAGLFSCIIIQLLHFFLR